MHSYVVAYGCGLCVVWLCVTVHCVCVWGGLYNVHNYVVAYGCGLFVVCGLWLCVLCEMWVSVSGIYCALLCVVV